MEDLDQRRVAIQKLQLVRRFAHQDREPCAVLPGLYIGSAVLSVVCSTREYTVESPTCLTRHLQQLVR